MNLDHKIEYSINLIKKAEKIALNLNPEGFYLAFSGGKDSQVIYKLCEMAGVKFHAHMNLTNLDPKPVLDFVRDKYPNVKKERPKISFFKWLEKKQLPTRQIRWCCEKMKEGGGTSNVVIIGIRKAESAKRAKRQEFTHEQCKKGLDKFILSPILEWSDREVWEFIKKYIGFWCELYDKGHKRIGCIGCPMSSPNKKIREFYENPKFKYPIIKALKVNIIKGAYKNFVDKGLNENDLFEWWISNKSVKQFFADKKQYKIVMPD